MALYLNEDNGNFFGSRGRAGIRITKKVVEDFVMQYVNSNVDTLFICPNAQRTSYKSDVWDAFWENCTDENDKKVAAMKQAYEDGIDVYKIMTDTCRQNNLKCFISMRMNDLHAIDDSDHFFHSEFWKKHPEYWRVPNIGTSNERALDFSIKEVRDYSFLLIEELFERNDFDGFEFDWMRFFYHIKPGYELQTQDTMTEFIRRTRKLADKYEKIRGHKIQISARIPSRPRTAFELGYDYLTWAREGLVDNLVATSFFYPTDNDIPIELWKSTLKGTNVKLSAGLEQGFALVTIKGGYEGIFHSMETLRGSIISFLNRGADNIYLFNIMDQFCLNKPIITEDLTIESLNKKSRRHVITSPDIIVPGACKEQLIPPEPINRATIRANIGPKPPLDKKAYLILGIEPNKLPKDFKVSLNTVPLKLKNVKLSDPKPLGNVFSFGIDISILKEGYNLIDINSGEKVKIQWAEIYIADS